MASRRSIVLGASVVAGTAFLLCILGVWSYTDTARTSTGEFCSQDQWTFVVRDEAGVPIEGALVEVLLRGTNRVVEDFFVQYGMKYGSVFSGGDGEAICRPATRVWTGTVWWRLFWIIRMETDEHPGFDVRVCARDYTPRRFPLTADMVVRGKRTVIVLKQ